MFCKKLEIKNPDAFQIGDVVLYKFRKWIYKGIKMRKAVIELKEGEKPFNFGRTTINYKNTITVFFNQIVKVQ